jgi:hypothetical protein
MLTQLTAHLLGAGAWDELEALLTDPTFLETRCQAG